VSALLEVEGLGKRFQGLVANADIDFSLARGEIRSVIGPNGAGKTTFISMISGHLAPTTGRIRYKGQDITRLPVVRRARLGIGRKFQTPSLFDNLSARENVELAVLRARAPRRRIGEVLDRVRLGGEARTPAKHLPHGQRQWLEIALLLANAAELVLLDEPTAGMTAEETHATGALIRELARELGLSTIVIEHDINFIRDLAAPVTVLHLGRVLTQGPFEAVAADPQVRDVYLGNA
jgi:urea transport system ATP-binding protein